MLVRWSAATLVRWYAATLPRWDADTLIRDSWTLHDAAIRCYSLVCWYAGMLVCLYAAALARCYADITVQPVSRRMLDTTCGSTENLCPVHKIFEITGRGYSNTTEIHRNKNTRISSNNQVPRLKSKMPEIRLSFCQPLPSAREIWI